VSYFGSVSGKAPNRAKGGRKGAKVRAKILSLKSDPRSPERQRQPAGRRAKPLKFQTETLPVFHTRRGGPSRSGSDSGLYVAGIARPPQGWPTLPDRSCGLSAAGPSIHFASNLLEIFGGGLAQALRLMLVADLHERRHGGFQNLGGLPFVFDFGPLKKPYGKPDPSYIILSMAFVLGFESPDSIVTGIPASASRRNFWTSRSSGIAPGPFRCDRVSLKRLP
jgi:hypothetical protein